MTDVLLPLSIILCAVGPIIGRFSEGRRRFNLALMMLLLVVLVSVLFSQLLPEILDMFGIPGLLFVFSGLGLAWFLERSIASGSGPRGADIPRVVWLCLIIGHAFMDGLSIYIAANCSQFSFVSESHTHNLGFGVLLHRAILVPLIWRHLSYYSSMFRISVMTLIALGTLVGYFFGDHVLVDVRLTIAVEAIVTGGLLHINFEVLSKIRRGLSVK